MYLKKYNACDIIILSERMTRRLSVRLCVVRFREQCKSEDTPESTFLFLPDVIGEFFYGSNGE